MKPLTLIAGVAALVVGSTANAQFLTNQDFCIDSGIDNVGPGLYVYNIQNATTGTAGQEEPFCGASEDVEHDIWFTYTATVTGNAHITTCLNGQGGAGGDFDTKLIAWPGGNACPLTFTSLACDDDACGQMSFIAFPVTAGTSYIIQAGTSGFSLPHIGSIYLLITEEAPSSGIGNSYCGPGAPNSGGNDADLRVTGSTSIMQNDLNFQTLGVPNGPFGYYLVSRTKGFSTPPGSNGNMCLGGDIGRYSNTALQSPFPFSPDLNDLPTNTPGSQQTLPGDTLHFQLWYRDGAASNMSNAMEIQFQ